MLPSRSEETWLAAFNASSARVLLALASVGLLAMTVIISWQVFGRFVLGSSPSWTEQTALTLMIWYALLAGSVGVRERFHIQILALKSKFGPVGQLWLERIADASVAVCALAMVILGLQLVLGTWNQTIPGVGLPRGVAYLAIPISGLFSLSFLLEHHLIKAGSA